MPDINDSSRPDRDPHAEARRGTLAATGAFVIWGLLPLYLKPLTHLPPSEVLAHRIAWCLLFVLGWLGWQKLLGEVIAVFRKPRALATLMLTAALITVNWLLYLWAVANERVLDASLGYFINPLVNVLLGVVVLSERLNPRQWTAVALACVGVLWLTIAAGELPWVSLVLAVTFGTYGLVRKMVPVNAVPGLAIETILLTPFALAWLFWLQRSGAGAFGQGQAATDALLIGSGLLTALPLALFATGARLIPYAAIGMIQYIGPTLQFVVGLAVYGEPFSSVRAVGFAIIWAGVAVYLLDNRRSLRRARGIGIN